MCDFAKLKQLLLDLDFPTVHLLSYEELLKVFETQNRRFLVKWAVGQVLTPEELSDCDVDLNNDEDLADALASFGLCVPDDKLKFVLGDLGAKKDLALIWRMLNTLLDLKPNDEEDEEDPVDVSVQKISSIGNVVNLFPQLGPIKTCVEAERNTRIAAMREELETLTKEVDILENNAQAKDPSQPLVVIDMDQDPKIHLAEQQKVVKEILTACAKTYEKFSDGYHRIDIKTFPIITKKCLKNFETVVDEFKEIIMGFRRAAELLDNVQAVEVSNELKVNRKFIDNMLELSRQL